MDRPRTALSAGEAARWNRAMATANDRGAGPVTPGATLPSRRLATGFGRLQELVLRAVARLGPGCTTDQVRTFLHDAFGHGIAFGAVSTTLDRLEAKGMVSRRRGSPTARRGGRAPRLYAVEPAGTDTLRDLDRLAATVNGLAGGVRAGPDAR